MSSSTSVRRHRNEEKKRWVSLPPCVIVRSDTVLDSFSSNDEELTLTTLLAILSVSSRSE